MFKTFGISVFVLASLTAVGPALAGPAGADHDWDANSTPMTMSVPEGARTLGEQFFRVEWTAMSVPQGESTITGYVYNDYGRPAENVQLDISGIDGSGRALASVIQPVHGLVPAQGRAYFEIPVPGSQSYQVRVLSFDFVESRGGD